MAKFRRSPAEGVAITQIRSCSLSTPRIRHKRKLKSPAPCAGVGVGHHAHRAQRLDPLDHLSQKTRDARAPDQECLFDARCREATRLLLRPVWVLQQKLERC